MVKYYYTKYQENFIKEVEDLEETTLRMTNEFWRCSTCAQVIHNEDENIIYIPCEGCDDDCRREREDKSLFKGAKVIVIKD